MSSATSRLFCKLFRHIAGDDPLGQPFDDGGLADARLADQRRVVLGAPRQDLHDPVDLGCPPDERTELVRSRAASVRSKPSASMYGVLVCCFGLMAECCV